MVFPRFANCVLQIKVTFILPCKWLYEREWRRNFEIDLNLTKKLFCKIIGSSYPFPCLKYRRSLCTDSKCRRTLQDSIIIILWGWKVKEEILDVDIHINLLLSQPMGWCAFFSSHSTCTKVCYHRFLAGNSHAMTISAIL